MQNTFRKAADACKTAKRVFDKLKETRITPYNGDDAYYSGSDGDYEEFLKTMEDTEDIDNIENAEKTEDEAPNDNIEEDIKESIGSEEIPNEADADKMSDAEDIGGDDGDTKRAPSWQAMLKGFAERYHTDKEEKSEAEEKTARDIDELEKRVARLTELAESDNGGELDKAVGAVNEKLDKLTEMLEKSRGQLSEAAKSMADTSDEARTRVEAMTGVCADISARINQISEIMLDIKAQNSQNRARVEAISDAAGRIERICGDISSTTSAMGKLNDNVFELKKAQLETKRALIDQMDIIDSVRRRFSIGITILCLITAVSVILQIFNLLY